MSKVFGVLALFLWWLTFHIFDYDMAHRPKFPTPATGMVYRLENHGAAVFITSGDWYLFYGCMAAAILCFLAGALYYFGERIPRSGIDRLGRGPGKT